jgi:hypothetical protein
MMKVLQQLRSRSVQKRLDAANDIIRDGGKFTTVEIVDALVSHPGFAQKKGKRPVDCQTYTKRALKAELTLSVYSEIDDDPYRDEMVLADLYMGDQESTLLSGAKNVAENDFYKQGGRETLDVLKKIFQIDDDDTEHRWVAIYEKGHATYSDYLYTETIKVKIEKKKYRVLAVFTDGKIMEIPYDEYCESDEFIRIQKQEKGYYT